MFFTALQNLSNDNEVTLTWVPGHSDIPGNEKEDESARSIAEFIGTEHAVAR